jgi:ribosome-associated protein
VGKAKPMKTKVKAKAHHAKKIVAKKPAAKKAVLKKPAAKKPVRAVLPVRTAVSAPRPSVAKGVPEQLRAVALKALDERQAEQVITLDLRGKSALADYLIIGTGRSTRQVAALAEGLREKLQAAGVKQIRIEGLPQADWALVDAGDVIVHLFRAEVRKFYNIEKIYGLEAPDGAK